VTARQRQIVAADVAPALGGTNQITVKTIGPKAFSTMLTFLNGCSERFCDGLSRRSFLQGRRLALGG